MQQKCSKQQKRKRFGVTWLPVLQSIVLHNDCGKILNATHFQQQKLLCTNTISCLFYNTHCFYVHHFSSHCRACPSLCPQPQPIITMRMRRRWSMTVMAVLQAASLAINIWDIAQRQDQGLVPIAESVGGVVGLVTEPVPHTLALAQGSHSTLATI